MVVGVVSLVVMFLHLDFVDVAVVDIWQNTAQQELFFGEFGEFELFCDAFAGF